MSLTLKEQTREHHDNVERSEFAEILLSGKISPALYYAYLSAQYENYKVLEETVDIPKNLEVIFRAPLIMQDMHELEDMYGFEEITTNLDSVDNYIKYINNLKSDGENDRLLAHLYVRHFGDLHGGQIIKKRIPGSGFMYEFPNRKDLIVETRKLLDDSMGEEAGTCFDFAEQMFNELTSSFDEDEYFFNETDDFIDELDEDDR